MSDSSPIHTDPSPATPRIPMHYSIPANPTPSWPTYPCSLDLKLIHTKDRPTLTFLLNIAICTDLFWNIWHVYHHYVVLSYTSPVSKTNTEVIPLSMRTSSSMSDPWHIFGKCGGGFCFFPLCSQIPAALLLGPSAYLSVVTCYFPFGQRFPEMTVEHRIVPQIKC